LRGRDFQAAAGQLEEAVSKQKREGMKEGVPYEEKEKKSPDLRDFICGIDSLEVSNST
jgi:hypothetical protein